jgi:hypothetical protein
MRTLAQLRSEAAETNSSQPWFGSEVPVLSSEDPYSRDPVQVHSSTNAILAITSTATKSFYGVIKLGKERQPPS